MATKKKAEPNLVPAVRLETDPPDLDPFVDETPDDRLCQGCVHKDARDCPADLTGKFNLCNLPRPGCDWGVIWRKKPVYGNEED